MSNVYHLHDDILVVGWSCRVPGANSISDLWSLLLDGRCAVTRVPEDRFALGRFGHPRKQERGKSYTWAAGVLDDVWGFDAAAFGISPREAEQMDPQQRILLQLTWEALEDAGITRASIAGADVGVFIGGSSTEYANSQYGDPAAADAHFATGNALACLSNRVSYIFNLRGPSLTIDTACSSSLVALHQAVEAMRGGRIDTAIVGGINVIASPYTYISFAQASMLSPSGLCRAFDAKADGFVRAEGGAVLVLRRAGLAQTSHNPVHGVILASDVNSDGRTNGISLPSEEAQEALLNRIYSRARIEPDRLAFLEAHGTGTAVGDPIEASAIGRSLGSDRAHPLPIGSVKTNIGHLEPASGVVGVLKALLALNHGLLPRSLHFEEPNPRIEFERLNLTVCSKSLLLPKVADQCAGVNSFGFGGTNAHVIVAPGRLADEFYRAPPHRARFLALSAETKPALAALAKKYAARVTHLSDEDSAAVAGAAVHHRDWLSQRLVVSTVGSDQLVDALDAYAAGGTHPALTSGAAVGRELPIAFVFTGNGSQFPGMGLAAYRSNETFRARFDEIDEHFKKLAHWSLKEALVAPDLGERLDRAMVAQPLIFAIESAATATLRASGVHPAIVLGHSVGEIAAAEAAGILDLSAAVKVIHARSHCQELVRGKGRMAAVMLDADLAASLVSAVPGVEIAAINGPRATTVAGSAEALAALRALAQRRGIAMLDLGLDYPFHTAIMAEIETRLLAALEDIDPSEASIPYVSTVTGSVLPGLRLGADYWWNNVRKPVRFSDAVHEAAKLGARCFIEIGPRSLLLKHIIDCLGGEGYDIVTFGVLERKDDGCDPFDRAAAKAVVAGARVDTAALFGSDPGGFVPLPSYPWQPAPFRLPSTTETPVAPDAVLHPFAGVRHDGDGLEWRAHIDTALLPELADHRVGRQVLFPGTGFLEIALTVARQWLKSDTVALANFEILAPLDLTSGEAREVVTRVSPGSQSLEILSRPRFSQGGSIVNCHAKMLHVGGDAGAPPLLDADAEAMGAEELYALAESCALNYGPAFRLVREARIDGRRLISVALEPPRGGGRFVLDPMRLDACIHGLFAALPGLDPERRGVAYLPVRLDEATLYAANAVPLGATLEMVSAGERSILANLFVLGENDAIIAVLRGVRCQAVPVRRVADFDSMFFVQALRPADATLAGETGARGGSDDVIAAAERLRADPDAAPSARARLIEAWATTASYHLALALAERRALDPAALIEAGRLPEELRPWLVNLLRSLELAGLAADEGERWTLVKDSSLPKPRRLLALLATECGAAAPELLLAGEVSAFIRRLATERAIASRQSVITQAALDFFCLAHANAADAQGLLLRLLRDAALPKDRALRVLQLGAGPLARDLAARGNLRVFVLEPDERRIDPDLAQGDVAVLEKSAALEPASYDLVVASDALSRLSAEVGLADLRKALAPGGLLVALEPPPSLFHDLVFGLDPAWFATSLADFPSGPLRSAAEWQAALEGASFRAPRTATIRCGGEIATLLVGGAAHDDAAAHAKASIGRVLSLGGGALAHAVAEHAAAENIAIAVGDAGAPFEAAANILYLLPHGEGDPVATLAARCLDLKALAERIGAAKTTLWLVFRDALAGNPVAAGLWAFSRTLANEFPHVTVRRVDLGGGLPDRIAGERIVRLLVSGTSESEIRIDDRGVHVLRVEPALRGHEDDGAAPAEAARLERHHPPAQRLQWQPVARGAPAADEVEVAVEATGVNFRDLMWMLFLLPDDILEEGFSGPSLGLECAGRVLRAGASVKHLKPGDAVVAFAPSAFATHVTIPARHVLKLPQGLSCEAAATIPVAFLTAYYSIITLARLQRGEWVLVHGGAGGVGMAAIQIAQARGARIIATAGSRAKRDLLAMMGVAHVLDSRSTSFVDGVRAITGEGVDVVLNSLAGEGMERSIACLRSFGRFVELGKRDYVADTHVGLRPFRRNLSYYGVDIDQLVMGRAALAARVFAEVMRRFQRGTYAPLPYTVFEASQVADAFHLMQQSAHIGKIVVRPPDAARIKERIGDAAIDPARTHLVTGAFGGFGLETVKWLVARGARHLVLLGRSGAASAEARDALQRFAAAGVRILAEPCDVADQSALQRIFERAERTMPPLAGIIHAAMVLADGAIAQLDDERLRRVFEPKIRGAENLDALTSGMTLDYFVLFSSVSTLIGNPGQGNYVAANAYLEALARRRRAAGLPGLAIGWGPITDTGVYARMQKPRGALDAMASGWGMTAKDALDLLGKALALGAGAGHAVLTIAAADMPQEAMRLPVLQAPAYGGFGRRRGQSESGLATLDLRALLARDATENVRRIVMQTITAQLARVLRFREEEISRSRPLAEIGLDSLMGLELAMQIEKAFGLKISLAGSAGGLTVTSLADEIIAKAKAGAGEEPAEDATFVPLARLHVQNATSERVEQLREIAGAKH